MQIAQMCWLNRMVRWQLTIALNTFVRPAQYAAEDITTPQAIGQVCCFLARRPGLEVRPKVISGFGTSMLSPSMQDVISMSLYYILKHYDCLLELEREGEEAPGSRERKEDLNMNPFYRIIPETR